MLNFLIKRVLWVVPLLILISILAFILITLPPGDYATAFMARAAASGEEVDPAVIAALRERLGLDQPLHVQYWKWITGILQGDFGRSFEWDEPVGDLIWGRMGYTLILTLATLLFTWAVALPIGIYSAVRQYSIGDYAFTTFGFLGLATPNFLLALVLMFIFYTYFGVSIGGLFSAEYRDAPWTLGKIADLINHMWVP